MGTIEKYGCFNDKEGCFELVNEPPRKWVNLHYNKIGKHEVYAEATNIGDGPITIRDEAGRTCLLVSWDCKYLYIRDEESGTVFSPWGAPAPTPVQDKICKYYAGKTEISGTCEGLRVTERIFVPKDYVMEVWSAFVENQTDRPRKVSLFAYAMFQLTGSDHEGKYVGKDNFAMVHPEINGVFVTNRNTQIPSNRYKGFIVTLNNFVGGSGYRDNFTRSEFSLGTPKILYGWNADNKPGYGPDCAGVVQVTITIPPRSKGRADFLIGQATGIEEVSQLLKDITPEKLDKFSDEQQKIEIDRADAFTVNTGNSNGDSLMNHFVKKQMYSYLINKSGFRDNLQIDNAICLFDYQVAEDNLLRALASQYPNGSVPHGFRPLNRMQYSDKPAWIMMTVPGLITESGNIGLLDKTVPFFESLEKGTVWEHMLRAMRYLADDLGPNGFCRQHHADWNDGLEATAEAGERESIMVTQQLCYGLLRVKELAQKLNKNDIVQEATQLYNEFAKRLNESAWDGEWYVRTICGDGYRIGSKENAEGKIFMNTQNWAILSEIAPADRARMCMESVDKHLTVDIGYRICAPSFSKYDPRVGRMSNSMPGHVENGGCYCHAAGFKGVADCMLGRAEQAWETYIKTLPDTPYNSVTKSEMEPFSFTNSFSMVDLVYGRAGYPWRTGTAGWFTVMLLEWILGARRHFDGLLIDPCLTKTIQQASLKRKFRGATYNISLDNSAGRCKGASKIVVDGETIKGNIVPDFRSGIHTVNVTI